MEAAGVATEQVVAALRSENQESPLGSIRSLEQERGCRNQRPAADATRTSATSSSPQGSAVVRLWQVADVTDGPQEIESLALYNGQRTVRLSVQKSQGENTIAVVDGLKRALDEAQALLPPGVKTEINRDNSRGHPRLVATVAAHAARRLRSVTVLIVFLFLILLRSTVITGADAADRRIGTFLVMYVFGFTIQHDHADWQLSLCVGPADRRRHRRARKISCATSGWASRRARRRSTARRDRSRGAGDDAVHRRVFLPSASWAASSQVLPRIRPSPSSPRC